MTTTITRGGGARRYLCSDLTYRLPDTEHLFLRADGTWVKMVLIPSNQSEFAAMTWNDLSRLSEICAINDTTNFKPLVGFTKPIQISGIGTVDMQLVALNNGVHEDGSVAGFTFLSKQIVRMHKMYSSMAKVILWKDCSARTVLNDEIYQALPDDFRNVIKPQKVERVTQGCTGSNNPPTEPIIDNVTLPTHKQVCGTELYLSSSKWGEEGTQFDWFAAHTSASERTKQLVGSSNRDWWQSTPYDYRSGSACFMTMESGYQNGGYLTETQGLTICVTL